VEEEESQRGDSALRLKGAVLRAGRAMSVRPAGA